MERQACDRCHGQKLRCTRELGSDGCIRCQRARAVCLTTSSGFSSNKRSSVDQNHTRHNRNKVNKHRYRTSNAAKQVGNKQAYTNPRDATESTHWLDSTILSPCGDSTSESPPRRQELEQFSLQDLQTQAQMGRNAVQVAAHETNSPMEVFEHMLLAAEEISHSSPLSLESAWTSQTPIWSWGENNDDQNGQLLANGSGERVQKSTLQLPQSPGKTTADTDDMKRCMQELLSLHMNLYQDCNDSENDRSEDVETATITENSRALTIVIHSMSKHCRYFPKQGRGVFPSDYQPAQTSQISTDSATVLMVLACYIQLLLSYTKFVSVLRQRLLQSSSQQRCPSFAVPGWDFSIDRCLIPPSKSELDVILKAQLVEYLLKCVSRCVRIYLALCIGLVDGTSSIVGLPKGDLRDGDLIPVKRPVELLVSELAKHEEQLRRALDGLCCKQ